METKREIKVLNGIEYVCIRAFKEGVEIGSMMGRLGELDENWALEVLKKQYVV